MNKSREACLLPLVTTKQVSIREKNIYLLLTSFAESDLKTLKEYFRIIVGGRRN